MALSCCPNRLKPKYSLLLGALSLAVTSSIQAQITGVNATGDITFNDQGASRGGPAFTGGLYTTGLSPLPLVPATLFLDVTDPVTFDHAFTAANVSFNALSYFVGVSGASQLTQPINTIGTTEMIFNFNAVFQIGGAACPQDQPLPVTMFSVPCLAEASHGSTLM